MIQQRAQRFQLMIMNLYSTHGLRKAPLSLFLFQVALDLASGITKEIHI
jgi:hypothetical protein